MQPTLWGDSLHLQRVPGNSWLTCLLTLYRNQINEIIAKMQLATIDNLMHAVSTLRVTSRRSLDNSHPGMLSHLNVVYGAPRTNPRQSTPSRLG